MAKLPSPKSPMRKLRASVPREAKLRVRAAEISFELLDLSSPQRRLRRVRSSRRRHEVVVALKHGVLLPAARP